MPASEHPDWLIPRWWADDRDTTISRNRLIDKWTTAAAPPKPEKKVFVPELSAWSTALGVRDWVKERYTPTAAGLASRSVKAEIDDPEAWWAVSALYAHYGDPLARFTSGFQNEAKARRPEKLPKRVSAAVREFERNETCVAARKALLEPPEGTSVLTTEAHTDRFLEDPQPRYSQVLAAAMRGYAAALIAYRDRLASTISEVPPDVDVQIALNACIDALAIYGETKAPRRDATDKENDKATALLDQLLHDHPELLTHNTDIIGEAWASVHKTLTNWMIDGRDVTNATILFTRIKAVRTSRQREQWREEARSVPDEALTLSEVDTGTGARWEAAGTEAFDRVEQQALLGRIRAALTEYPATVMVDGEPVDCWEKQYASTILDNGAAVSEHLDFAHLRPLVLQLWQDGKPATARCNTAVQAAEDIRSMLRLALSAVVETAEDLDGLGKTKKNQTRRERTTEINQMLNKSRSSPNAETEKKR